MRNLLSLFCCVVIVTAAAWFFSTDVIAKPGFFEDNCSTCHSDDNVTCNGCHKHGAQDLSASADRPDYAPEEEVVVTFDGGKKSGWVRAILYDQSGSEIARASGPTGNGDNGQPDPVTFPITLTAPAPAEAGQYTWQVAWWGSPYDEDNETAYPHGPEVRTEVTFTVLQASPVEATSWGRIKALWR